MTKGLSSSSSVSPEKLSDIALTGSPPQQQQEEVTASSSSSSSSTVLQPAFYVIEIRMIVQQSRQQQNVRRSVTTVTDGIYLRFATQAECLEWLHDLQSLTTLPIHADVEINACAQDAMLRSLPILKGETTKIDLELQKYEDLQIASEKEEIEREERKVSKSRSTDSLLLAEENQKNEDENKKNGEGVASLLRSNERDSDDEEEDLAPSSTAAEESTSDGSSVTPTSLKPSAIRKKPPASITTSKPSAGMIKPLPMKALPYSTGIQALCVKSTQESWFILGEIR